MPTFFLWWSRFKPESYIYYVLSIPTELSSRGQLLSYFKTFLNISFLEFFFTQMGH